jgi:hypothetical protein
VRIDAAGSVSGAFRTVLVIAYMEDGEEKRVVVCA